ncbi:hypothetical protein D3C73_787330 [compost metagenome]
MLAALPGAHRIIHVDRGIMEMDRRVRGLEMDRRRQCLMLQCQNTFQQAGNPCCMVQMSDIRFDGANRAKLFFSRVSVKSPCNSVNLNRVAQAGCRPMGLNQRNGLRMNIRILPCPDNQLFLCFGVRCGNADRLSILIDCTPFDEGINMVSILYRPLGILQ